MRRAHKDAQARNTRNTGDLISPPTSRGKTLFQPEFTVKFLDLAAKRATRLRQGILKQTFEHRLIPQDPNDEPAYNLLKRMRQELSPLSRTGNCSPVRSEPDDLARRREFRRSSPATTAMTSEVTREPCQSDDHSHERPSLRLQTSSSGSWACPHGDTYCRPSIDLDGVPGS